MKKHIAIVALSSCALSLVVGPLARAEGSPERGQDLFQQECGDCHSAVPGKNKKGPSLAGVIGRQAGSLAGFAGYSDAMKGSGITWSAERLDPYITAPRKVVPGGKMKYDGLDDAAARADIIAFLQSLH